MKHFEPNHAAPLALGDDGTIRVIGSRVTLDTIVGQFKAGCSPEHIQEGFPSLNLQQIYGAISYYLDHSADVEKYLKEREAEADGIRAQIEADPKVGALRKRLRELRDRQSK